MPENPAALKGVPTYAYPVYEMAAELLLLAALWVFRTRLRQRPGLSFLVAAMGYGAIRFVLTFLRQEPMVFLGLQEAQVIAVITSALALSVLLWRVLNAPQPFTEPPSPALSAAP